MPDFVCSTWKILSLTFYNFLIWLIRLTIKLKIMNKKTSLNLFQPRCLTQHLKLQITKTLTLFHHPFNKWKFDKTGRIEFSKSEFLFSFNCLFMFEVSLNIDWHSAKIWQYFKRHNMKHDGEIFFHSLKAAVLKKSFLGIFIKKIY